MGEGGRCVGLDLCDCYVIIVLRYTKLSNFLFLLRVKVFYLCSMCRLRGVDSWMESSSQGTITCWERKLHNHSFPIYHWGSRPNTLDAITATNVIQPSHCANTWVATIVTAAWLVLAPRLNTYLFSLLLHENNLSEESIMDTKLSFNFRCVAWKLYYWWD